GRGHTGTNTDAVINACAVIIARAEAGGDDYCGIYRRAAFAALQQPQGRLLTRAAAGPARREDRDRPWPWRPRSRRHRERRHRVGTGAGCGTAPREAPLANTGRGSRAHAADE